LVKLKMNDFQDEQYMMRAPVHKEEWFFFIKLSRRRKSNLEDILKMGSYKT